ncbi:MAG: hypothetical protein V4717_09845 [Bacteroidota bacterium]
MRYKILILSFIFLSTLGACKKTINNIKEDLMVNLITSHTWKVVKFMEGTSNLTSEYAVYDFEFEKNSTVKAVLNGVTEATGTWVGDETSQSITAAFPGAGAKLSKLTGKWTVTNTKSLPWRVFSNRYEGSKQFILDLQEK